MVKNPPAGSGDIRDMGLIPASGGFLEEGMATHSNMLAWINPWAGGAWWVTVHRVARVRHD